MKIRHSQEMGVGKTGHRGRAAPVRGIRPGSGTGIEGPFSRGMLARAIAQTRDICEQRLHDKDLADVGRLLESRGAGAAACRALVGGVTAVLSTQTPIRELKASLGRREDGDGCLIERFLLVTA